MRKFLMGLVVALIATTLTLATIAPSTAKPKDNPKHTKVVKKHVSSKCVRTPKPFTTKDGVTVLSTKTCFSVKLLKKMGCNTKAGKIERPAPPRDPRSECRKKIKVHFKVRLKTPKPPEGWLCGKASLFLEVWQKAKAHGLSISIANGRVDTWAQTHLRLKDNMRGWVKSDCIRVPEIPVTPPPPPPPPYDECPYLPGNQPKGYECNPPEETPDAIEVTGWSPWHLIQNGDAVWGEVAAKSNGKEVMFSGTTSETPSVCTVVETNATGSGASKTLEVRVRPITGATGQCTISGLVKAGTASEPWSFTAEVAPTPPGSWD